MKGPNPPITTESYSRRLYQSFGTYVECAQDFVVLSGYLHEAYQLVFNEKTNTHTVTQLVNVSGVSGEGLTTGDTYHASGITRQSYDFSGNLPTSYTLNNRFVVVAGGTGNNLVVHTTSDVTFNPDGTVESQVTSSSIECK